MSDAATPTAAPAAPTPAGGESSAPVPEANAAAPAQTAEEYEELLVRGQTKRVPKSQLKSLAQRGYDSAEAYREAKALRESFEGRLAKAKADPRELRAFLSEHGIDVRGVSSKFLIEDMEEASLTPEQKEARDLKAKLEAYEAEKKQAEEAQRSEAMKAEVQKQSTAMAQRFAAALEKVGIPAGKPQAAWAIKRMAALEEQNLDSPEPLSADELAAALREDLEAEHLALFGALPADALLAKLGGPDGEQVKAIVRAYMEHRTKSTAPRVAGVAQAPAPTPPRAADGKFTRPVSRDDAFFENFIGKR